MCPTHCMSWKECSRFSQPPYNLTGHKSHESWKMLYFCLSIIKDLLIGKKSKNLHTRIMIIVTQFSCLKNIECSRFPHNFHFLSFQSHPTRTSLSWYIWRTFRACGSKLCKMKTPRILLHIPFLCAHTSVIISSLYFLYSGFNIYHIYIIVNKNLF